MVGAGHPTKADTLNRFALMFLNNDGSPIIGIKDVSVNLSNNTTDAAHDIDLSAGGCFDSALTEPMVLASTLVKQIDAAWAVGTNAGGMDTGAFAASTLYAVWLIKRTDTGVVDALFSLSFTSPTMPTNYDKKRLIGYVVTDEVSNIISFAQNGDYFRMMGANITDISDGTIANLTEETGTLSVPANCLAQIYGHLTNTTTTGTEGVLWIFPVGASGTVGTVANAFQSSQHGAAFDRSTSMGWVLVDGSSQIKYAATQSDGAAVVNINTVGCLMLTRSNP